MRYQKPRGTEDQLPPIADVWAILENRFRAHAHRYGYRELRTPTFEDTDLFLRTSGETSDIVTKQMYTFLDKGDRSITLKPEGTAPAVRALAEGGALSPGTLTRVFYVTPIFRYERPQKGRLREAHQFGLELVGSDRPEADAEVIEATVRFYESVGIDGVVVSINSLGRDECRTRYRAAILEFAQPLLKDFGEEERGKVERNPLRLLDSKDPATIEAMKSAPAVLDYLEPESAAAFDTLQALLAEAGVAFRVEPSIVRGLDYYTGTVFEVVSGRLGAQGALCGGGRYDNLIAEIGGPKMPSVGVGMGIERLVIVLADLDKLPVTPRPSVFVVSASQSAVPAVRALVRHLRSAGIAAETDIEGRSLKSQLRQADKSGARYAAVIGDAELASGTVSLRDLAKSEQRPVSHDELATLLGGS